MLIRALLLWPHNRADREKRTRESRDAHEEMDGLSHLEPSGVLPITYHTFPFPWNPLARKGTLLAGMDPLRTLRVLLACRRFDVLVSIAVSPAFLFLKIKSWLRLRLPVVIIDPALGDEYPARKKVTDLVLPRADHVIVYGRGQLDHLRRDYGDRVRATFLYHRMDTAFFDPAKAGPSAPSPGGAYLYSVGNDPLRDFPTLAQAVAGLEIRTLIQTRKQVPAPAGARVETDPGWVTYEQLRDRYAHAAVVVVPLLPTVRAGGINGLLEAMSMGRPVIATRSEGIEDYVRDGETALVVPPRDPAALRAAIDRLLANPSEAGRIGRNARRFCEEQCAMPVYAAKVAEILRDAIGKRGGRRLQGETRER